MGAHTKVVINRGSGPFALSERAARALTYAGVEGLTIDRPRGGYPRVRGDHLIRRDDPRLVEVVERLGAAAGLQDSRGRVRLVVVEVPSDVRWYVAESEEGAEFVAEAHRCWDETGERMRLG